MKRSVKKLGLILFLVLCIVYNFFGVSANSDRTTAMRFLKLAQDYMIKSDWDSVLSNVEIGLTYDNTIADLWYIKALACEQKREKPYIIIDLLETALTKDWQVYNNNGAKLLLADYFVHTLEYNKALELINDAALLLNKEALKTKAKIYYLTGEIQKARENIDVARRLLPLDTDFPTIFYTYENSTNLQKDIQNVSDELFFDLNENFLSLIYDYYTDRYLTDTDFLLLASSFAEKDLQINILKYYKTFGIKSPLYPIKALEAKLILPKDAINSFFSLSNNSINYNYLEKLLSLIPQEELKIVASFLDSFEGEILFDFNKDGIFELISMYKNGRPTKAYYEENQDGLVTWSCDFDYGTPRKIFLPESTTDTVDITFVYARYPYVSKVESKITDFNLIPDTVKIMPFTIQNSGILNEIYDFYIPIPIIANWQVENFLESTNVLVYYFSEKGKPNEDKVRFTLSNGKIVNANYYLDNIPYAHGVYENGQLIFRKLDKDFDGNYEITETYMNFEPTLDFQSNVDLESLMGTWLYEKDIWLASISVDMDYDGKPDYIEEYFQDGSEKKTWEGVSQTKNSEGEIVSVLINNPQSNLDIVMNYEKNKPVNFEYNDFVFPLFYDESSGFYFIQSDSDSLDSFDFVKIKQDLQNKKTSYAIILYETEKDRICAIKSFDCYIIWNLYSLGK